MESQDKSFVCETQDKSFVCETQDKSFVCETQDKSFVCEPEDLSSYTLKDLEQLLQLNKTVLDHYKVNLEKYKEKEEYLLEINLCMKQTEVDISHIEKEITKRKMQK